jgi:hypothetical protein
VLGVTALEAKLLLRSSSFATAPISGTANP